MHKFKGLKEKTEREKAHMYFKLRKAGVKLLPVEEQIYRRFYGITK